MTIPLKVLLVEDNLSDAELILHQLRRAGFQPEAVRVDTERDLLAALNPAFELVLSDYQLPQFNGLRTLQLVRERALQVPVIIVSGTIGEDVAVEALRLGAVDYLLKDRLSRLGPAVTNALEQRRLRAEKHAVDEALRLSEAHLSNLLDNASEAIISIDEDSTIILFNRSAEKMFGYRAEEIIGQSLDWLIPAALVSIHRQHAHDFLNEAKDDDRLALHLVKMGRELTSRRKDGSEFPSEISLSRLIEQGRITVTAIVTDVTERKQAEDSLRIAEANYRSILENAPVGFFQTTPAGLFLTVNPTMARSLGYASPEEMKDSVTDIGRQIYADLADRKEFLRQMNEYGEVREFVNQDRRKDGRIIWVSTNARRVKDAQGKFLYYEGFLTDITDRKQAEEAVREREKRFRALIENSSDAITLLDAKGSVIYDSPAAPGLLGYAPEDWLGREVFALIHPDDLSKIQDLFQHLVTTPGARVDKTFRVRHHSGAWLWLEAVATNLLAEPGVQAIVLNYHDVTDRKQAEVALSLFRTLIDRSSDAIEVIDPQTGRFLDVNERGCLDLGYRREEFLALSVFEIDPMVNPAIFYDLMKKIRTSGTELWEGVHRRKDGSAFPVEVNLKYVQLDREYLVSVVRDVTERKSADETIRRLATIVESSADAIVSTDLAGVVTDWNHGAEQMYGYSADEVKGRLITFLLPADRAKEISNLLDRFKGGERVAQYDTVRIRKNGQPIDVSVTLSALKNFKGQTIGVSSIARDVTERKRTEESMRLQSAALNAAANTIMITNREGTIEWVNSAYTTLTGYTAEEAIGKNPRDLVRSGKHDQAFYKQLWDTILAGETWQSELINRRKDGRLYTEEQTITPLKNAVGNISHFISIKQDITDRKQTEQRIADSLEFQQKILSAAPIGVLTYRATGECVSANAAAAEIVGTTPENLLAQNFRQIASWQDSGLFDIAVAALQSGAIQQRDVEVTTTFGRAVWLSVGMTPFQSGNELHLLFVFSDISNLKRVERELNTKVATLQTLAEIDHEIIATTDPQGILDLVCRRAAALVNVPKSIITARLAGELEVVAHFGIDDITSFNALFIQLRQAGVIDSISAGLRQAIAIEDLAASNVPLRVSENNPEGIRAVLIIPQVAYEHAAGALAVFDAQPHQWSADEIDLLSMLAGQAAIALDNARLYQSEREHRTLAEALAATATALNSTLDFDGVLDEILGNVGRVVPHDAASIMVIESGIAHVVRSRGFGERGVKEAVHQLRFPVETASNLRLMVETGQTAIVEDTHAEAKWIYAPELAWIASNLGAPIRAQGQVIGFISLDSATRAFFTATHAQHLQAFADQVAVAIENARLYQAEREQRAIADALRDTAAALSGTLDVDEVLDRILQNIERVVTTEITDVTFLEDNLTHIVRTHGYERFGVSTQAAQTQRYPVDQLANLQQMIETRQPVIIADVLTYPDWVTKPHFEWVRSYLGAPIRINEQVVGFIGLCSAEPNSFTPLHAEHLLAFADQAAIALQNARLLAETERRAEQFELLYDAGLALDQLLESNAQFESLFNIVLKSLHADRVEFFRYDQPRGQLRFETGIGYTDEQLQLNFQKLNFAIDTDEGIVSRVARHMEPLYLPIVLADPLWTSVDPSIRSAVWVPINYKDRLLGVLGVLSVRENAFSSQEQRLLTLFANQAAGALENARLLAELKRRALYLATLNEIGQATTSSLELDQVFLTLLEKVRQATDAEACSIALIDNLSGDLVFQQAVGGAAQFVRGLRLSAGEGLAGWVVQHRQSVFVSDMVVDPRAYPIQDQSGFVTHDLLAVPLLVREVVIGVIELVNKHSGQFSEDDRRLLESVATQTVSAIENSRLYEVERNQRQRLEILYQASRAINSTLDVNGILDRLTDEAMRVTRAAHGSVLAVRSELARFERRSLRGYSISLIEKSLTEYLPVDKGINGRAYQTGKIVYVPDVQSDPDYFALIPQTRAELVVPILRNGQVIGNLDLQSPQVDGFQTADFEFLRALTDQVSIALEKARLFSEVQQVAVELEDRVNLRTRELTEANLRLTELDHLKDQFVSMVSHEFRSPLTSILSSAEMLQVYNAKWTDAKKREHLARIQDSVHRMTDLLGDILTLGKMDAGKLAFDPKPIELHRFCREVIEESQLVSSHANQLILIEPTEALNADIDIILLRHILTNLLSNAIKYSPTGSRVELEVARQAEFVVFRVSDKGLGIPAEDQVHLFESFYRASNTGNIQGTGLGLAIVKRSVERHGGTLEFVSEVNQGTTFTVRLPINQLVNS
jgi:PAS domain S-box-containing protein